VSLDEECKIKKKKTINEHTQTSDKITRMLKLNEKVSIIDRKTAIKLVKKRDWFIEHTPWL
jgi:hypothetical protein